MILFILSLKRHFPVFERERKDGKRTVISLLIPSLSRECGLSLNMSRRIARLRSQLLRRILKVEAAEGLQVIFIAGRSHRLIICRQNSAFLPLCHFGYLRLHLLSVSNLPPSSLDLHLSSVDLSWPLGAVQ